MFSEVAERGEAKSDSRVNKFCVWKLFAQGQKDICLAPAVCVALALALALLRVCRKCLEYRQYIVYVARTYLSGRLPKPASVLVQNGCPILPLVGHFSVRVCVSACACGRQRPETVAFGGEVGFWVFGFDFGFPATLNLNNFVEVQAVNEAPSFGSCASPLPGPPTFFSMGSRVLAWRSCRPVLMNVCLYFHSCVWAIWRFGFKRRTAQALNSRFQGYATHSVSESDWNSDPKPRQSLKRRSRISSRGKPLTLRAVVNAARRKNCIIR